MNPQFESIASLYEKRLEVPAEKTSRPFILCPVGLVGAGKSTVVKPLAKECGLVRISNDEVRELFNEQKIIHSNDDAHKITYYLIEKYLKLGYGVAIDANCSSKKELLKKLSETFNIPLVWIHISPPENFIIEKLKNYPHGRLFKNADEAIEHYFRSKEERVELDKGIPFAYTFDTSREDLSSQISEAVNIIKSELN